MLLLNMSRLDDAVTQFQAALEKWSGNVRARLALARVLWQTRQPGEAQDELRHARWWLRVNAEYQPDVHNAWGWFHIDQRRWRCALEEFDAAQAYDRDHFANYWGQGIAYKELGDYEAFGRFAT